MRIVFVMMLVIAVFWGSTAGCKRDFPDSLIKEELYIDLLTEMHLLAALREMTDNEVLFREGQNKVLGYYNISREQFELSNDYYLRNVQEQQRRMREVRKKLEELSSELSDYELDMRRKRESESSTKPAGDSN